jgi:hypothetical protein
MMAGAAKAFPDAAGRLPGAAKKFPLALKKFAGASATLAGASATVPGVTGNAAAASETVACSRWREHGQHASPGHASMTMAHEPATCVGPPRPVELIP